MFSFAGGCSSLKSRGQLSQGGWSDNFYDPSGCSWLLCPGGQDRAGLWVEASACLCSLPFPCPFLVPSELSTLSSGNILLSRTSGCSEESISSLENAVSSHWQGIQTICEGPSEHTTGSPNCICLLCVVIQTWGNARLNKVNIYFCCRISECWICLCAL